METKLIEKDVVVGKYRLHTILSRDIIQNRVDIILVHGLSVSSKYMIPTANCLSEHFNVFAPDLPGYGKSTKPKGILTIDQLSNCLAEWMKKMKIDKAVLLGNSLGCQIIIHFALRHPNLLKSGILVGPTMDPRNPSLIEQWAMLILDTTREPLSSFLPIFSDYLKAGMRRTMKTAKMAINDRIETKLHKVKVPMLVIRGTRDPIVSQKWVEEITKKLPNAHLVLIKDAAHAVNYNSPQQLTKEVRKFLKR